MASTLILVNLTLRAIMELGIVLAFGYWGYQTGDTNVTKILLGIGTPVIGFGFWSLVDFRSAGWMAEPLRLTQELIISGLAALAGYLAGAHIPGLMLGAISIIHHACVYMSGGTLLKQ